jgi:hypothetical protein
METGKDYLKLISDGYLTFEKEALKLVDKGHIPLAHLKDALHRGAIKQLELLETSIKGGKEPLIYWYGPAINLIKDYNLPDSCLKELEDSLNMGIFNRYQYLLAQNSQHKDGSWEETLRQHERKYGLSLEVLNQRLTEGFLVLGSESRAERNLSVIDETTLSTKPIDWTKEI